MRQVNLKSVVTYIKKHQAVLKERLVFISIFLVIAIPLTILFIKTYEQSTALEEKKIEERIDAAYESLRLRLSSDFNLENSRSYKDYGILNSITVIGGNSRLFSEFFSYPDSSGPYCDFDSLYRQCRKGLVGHFQISHSGELLTPFYPDTSTGIGKSMWDNFSFDDQEQRKKTRDLIQHLLDVLDIKNGLPKRTVQTLDSTEAIDQLYDEIPDLQIPTRVELTSEEEALTYMAETAKNDTTIAPDIPIFNGSNTNVNITDLKIRMTSDYMVFFRTIYIGMLPIVQGFVVDKGIYLNYMTQEEQMAYAELPYAIELVYEDKVLLTIGKYNEHYKVRTNRQLAPPYEKISFKMYAGPTANSAGLTMLFSGLILLVVVAVCLVTIYRFTRSRLALAAKRQDFVSAITHELKTPLTAIKMYAELLQNSWVANEEKKQRYYGQIASEADRLSRLIQNVLNLSKLDGNRWNVQLRKERPKAVLDDFVATYSKNIEKQGFELTVSIDTDANNVAILIDRDAVMQILMNLVDNSLKFSKNASYKMISIELRVNGGDMYLAVRDYGPGIPPAEMKKVFQEFYRVENEMTRSTSGTGIGLSMVKKLCALTNMKIEIENTNPGLRTKIHFPPLDI